MEERIVDRAEKKLLLDQMVNRANASTVRIQEDDKAGGLSAKELFADIKFGSHAVFGDSSQNELPSCEDIKYITDRNRTESDSKGKLKGSEIKDLATYDANKKLSNTQKFGGIDFQRIRQERAHKEEDNVPSNLTGIAHLWQSISQLKKRQVKNRIVLVNAGDSGYGEDAVPVLAVNKDDMERSLNVKKEKTKAIQKFDHSDYCQHCGDGGLLVLCARCPVALHTECIGIDDPKHFKCCPHHRCTVCDKSSQQAGGMLFPCVSCTISYCEDCLPRDSPGLRFLGECNRFQKLGFNTTKLFAYIHCSEECEEYATSEFGWEPSMLLNEQVLPPAIDVTANFGGTGDEVSFSAPEASDEQLGPRTAKKSYVDTFDEEILQEGESGVVPKSGLQEMQGNDKTSTASGVGVPPEKRKLPQKTDTSSSDSSVSADDILSESSEDDFSFSSPKKPRAQKVAKHGSASGIAKSPDAKLSKPEQNFGNAVAPPNVKSPANGWKAQAVQQAFVPLNQSQYQPISAPFGNMQPNSGAPAMIPSQSGYHNIAPPQNGHNTWNCGLDPSQPRSFKAPAGSMGAMPIQNGARPNCPLPYNRSGVTGNVLPSSSQLPYNQLMQQARPPNTGLATVYIRVPNGLPPSQRYMNVPTQYGPIKVPLPAGASGGSVIPALVPTPLGFPSSTQQQGQQR